MNRVENNVAKGEMVIISDLSFYHNLLTSQLKQVHPLVDKGLAISSFQDLKPYTRFDPQLPQGGHVGVPLGEAHFLA